IVLADFDETQLQAARARLEALGHAVCEMRVDVSDAAAVAALARTASEQGVVRGVVHTAGVSPVQATTEQIVAVDVVGTARILDAFLPLVVPGTVAVCIASMAASMMPVTDDVVRAFVTTPTEELAALPALDATALDPGIAYALAKRANQAR